MGGHLPRGLRAAAPRARDGGRARPVLRHGRAAGPPRDPARPPRRPAPAAARDPRQPLGPARPAAAPHRPPEGRGRDAAPAAPVGRGGGRVRERACRRASAPVARRSSPSSMPATTRSCARAGASTRATCRSSWAGLLRERPDVLDAISTRFVAVMADELEDAAPAHRELLAALAGAAARSAPAIRARACAASAAPSEATVAWFADTYPDALEVELEPALRFGAGIAAAASDRRRGGARPAGGGPRRCPLLALPHRARPGPGRGARGRRSSSARGVAARSDLPDRRRRLARGPPAGRRPRGAQRPVPLRGRGGLLPASRGPRRAGVAAHAGRPKRLGSGRAGAHPAPRRPALRGPRPGDHDRPPAQARHDLGAPGRAREPAASARGARPDPLVPAPLPGGVGRARGSARRRLRAAPDRAHRPAPAPAVRGQPGDRRAPGEPLPPGRHGCGLVAAPATGLDARLHPPRDGGRRRRRAGDRGDRRARRPGRCSSPSPSR